MRLRSAVPQEDPLETKETPSSDSAARAASFFLTLIKIRVSGLASLTPYPPVRHEELYGQAVFTVFSLSLPSR